MSSKNRGGKHLSPSQSKKFSMQKLHLPNTEAAEDKKISLKQLRLKAVPRKWWIIGGSVAAVVLLVVFVMAFVGSKLDKLNYDDGTIELETSVDEIRQQLMEESGVDAEIFGSMGDIEMSDLEIIDDEGILNILLLGTDERDLEFSDFARSDAILLLSLDFNKHTIKLVSIERGLTVPVLLEGVPNGTVDLINHCFNYGGADLMMKEVEECLRVKVDRYVRVNLNVFIKVIEVLGGVEVELTEEEANYFNELILDTNGESTKLYYGDNENTFKANLHPGKNLLDGQMALAYAQEIELANFNLNVAAWMGQVDEETAIRWALAYEPWEYAHANICTWEAAFYE